MEKHRTVNCGQCSKRECCTTLCAAAETYANQDYVPQREWPTDPTILESTVVDYNWYANQCSNVNLTKKERQIVRLFGLGLNRRDICETLEITHNALDVAIHRLKKKLKEM